VGGIEMSEEIVNYFQRVLSGKTEKGDWLILLILFGSIFVLSCWFGGPVGGFTFILAIATIWNIRITQGLLKQSKEAFRQARQAFGMDTFNKMVSSTSQLNVELRSLKWSSKERTPYVENFAAGMLITLRNSDPIMFQEISKAIETWVKTDKGFPAITYLKALGKIKKHQKIEEKEFTNAQNSNSKL